MSDWMSDVAIEISIEQGPHGLPAIEIERRIRRHAPPVPQWCERPTCEGYWIIWTAHGPDVRYYAEEFLRQPGVVFSTGGWYGPIPDPPGQEKRDE